MKISQHAAVLTPSLTLALTAKARQMKASGIDVVSFGAGEPDFDTPDFIKQVAIDDIKKGETKYTAERGRPELVAAVVETLKRDYGLTYDGTQVMVSVGGKHSIFNVIFCLVDQGDEVIVPAPYWLTYPEQIRCAGGVPVCVSCGPEAGFKITPEQLEAAITPRTVGFIFNSPSNPTGAVYTKDEILALAAVLRRHPKVAIISDDLYQKLVYAGAEFHSIATLAPDLLDRTIIINGLSKAYAMTGWRLGWAAGPKQFMAACANLQSHSTSNVTSFTQRAAAAALLSDHSFLGPWLEKFDARRRLIVGGLNAIPGLSCRPEPTGAFYAFPDASQHYGRMIQGCAIKDSMTLSNALLEKAQVAVVPGCVFGEDRCIRLSYATTEEQIREGVRRIGEFLA